jgi:para-nitrobenzyl esterase
MKAKLFSALMCLFAVNLFAAEPIEVDGGRISGEPSPTNAKVMVYKGIPFAAPPIGELRWKAPQPVKAWDGVRECTAFGPSCPQDAEPLRRAYGTDIGPMSEDCLYLNVYTAGLGGGKRPVMVWIHGGGNTMGSAAQYNGTTFASKGVVLVAINYRLGAFGFLAHPELTKESSNKSSGNYGLLDQIAALEWVKRNIAAFGGDPGNVTIFGESAGAVNVGCLMASPLAKGLFHRAIAQSGSAIGVITPLSGEGARGSGEQRGVEFQNSLGADSLAAMRAKSSDDVLKTFLAANPGIGGTGPIVDGWVLPAAPVRAIAMGQGSPVPFMTGANANEGSIFLARDGVPATVEDYEKQTKDRFGENAARVLELYPVKEVKDIRWALDQIQTDQRFLAGSRVTLRGAQKQNPNAYLYFFTRVRPGGEALGAFHAAEISYVFGSLGERLGRGTTEETDTKLSEAMNSYWVNFAKTGDPNGQGLPNWPAYDTKGEAYMELGNEIAAKKELHKEKLDFFEKIAGTVRR